MAAPAPAPPVVADHAGPTDAAWATGVVVGDHTGELVSLFGRPMVCGADADSTADAVRASRADVAFVHGALPPEGGVAAITRLARQGVAVVLVGASVEPAELAAALRAGARAVMSEADGALLELALAAVRTGTLFVVPAPALHALLAGGADPFPELSPRERDVLAQLAKGADAHRAAVRLGLAPKTVRRHVTTILAKLGTTDAATAGRLARSAGLG